MEEEKKKGGGAGKARLLAGVAFVALAAGVVAWNQLGGSAPATLPAAENRTDEAQSSAVEPVTAAAPKGEAVADAAEADHGKAIAAKVEPKTAEAASAAAAAKPTPSAPAVMPDAPVAVAEDDGESVFTSGPRTEIKGPVEQAVAKADEMSRIVVRLEDSPVAPPKGTASGSLSMSDLVNGGGGGRFVPGSRWSARHTGAEVAWSVVPASEGLAIRDMRHFAMLPGDVPLVPDYTVDATERGIHTVTGYINIAKPGEHRFDIHLTKPKDISRDAETCTVSLEIGGATVLKATDMAVGLGDSTVLEGFAVKVPEGGQGLHPYRAEVECRAYVVPGDKDSAIADGLRVGKVQRDMGALSSDWHRRVLGRDLPEIVAGFRVKEPGSLEPRRLGDGDLFVEAGLAPSVPPVLDTGMEPGVTAGSWYGDVVWKYWKVPITPSVSGIEPSARRHEPDAALSLFDGTGKVAVRVFEGKIAVREGGPQTVGGFVTAAEAPKSFGKTPLAGVRNCAWTLRIDGGAVVTSAGTDVPVDGKRHGAFLKLAKVDLAKGVHPFSAYFACEPDINSTGLHEKGDYVAVDADGRIAPGEPDLTLMLVAKGPSEGTLRILGPQDVFSGRPRDDRRPVGMSSVYGKAEKIPGVLSFDDLVTPGSGGAVKDGRIKGPNGRIVNFQ